MSSNSPALSPQFLRELAEDGSLQIGVPEQHGGSGGSLVDAMDAVARVAYSSVPKALVLASQRLLIEALLQGQNIALREQYLPYLIDGDIGGSCAASWPLESDVIALAATDTGRGWRMSGRLPAIPNLDADWFLVSLPVSFEDPRSYSLVMLRSEEDGLQVHPAKEGGSVLELSNVFLREDEILSPDGPAAVANLAVASGVLQAAVWAGAARAATPQSCVPGDLQTHFAELRAAIAAGSPTTMHLSAVRARAARSAATAEVAAAS